jgi:hypothetical protein
VLAEFFGGEVLADQRKLLPGEGRNLFDVVPEQVFHGLMQQTFSFRRKINFLK